MHLILGYDAAWTPHTPSGVALLEWDNGRKRLRSARRGVTWPFDELNQKPHVIAIDMPIGKTPFQGRREADNAISRNFGRYKAAVHSPTAQRPGRVGQSICAELLRLGYRIVAADDSIGDRDVIEVFPLAALVRLLGLSVRPPYKVSKTSSYWPGVPRDARRRRLLEEWRRIEAFLLANIEMQPLIPEDFLTRTAASLKVVEDKIDAIICAYLGALYLEHALEAHGDGDAAIWVPRSRR